MTPKQRELLLTIARAAPPSQGEMQKAIYAAIEQLDAAERLFLAMETKKSGFFLRRKEYLVLRNRDVQTQWICNGAGCKCSGEAFDCQCTAIAAPRSGSPKRARPICGKCRRRMRLIDADTGVSLA